MGPNFSLENIVDMEKLCGLFSSPVPYPDCGTQQKAITRRHVWVPVQPPSNFVT